MNKFMLNETSYHGAGAINAIPDEIKSRGFKKAFVASDPDLVKFGVSKKVTDILDKEGIEYKLYTDIKDVGLEASVEAVLDEHGIFYDKSEVWIESERLYEVLYSFEMEV